MKTDKEIAQDFFDMLRHNGFEVKVVDFDRNPEKHENFNPEAVSYELHGSYGVFASFDFTGSNFYRVSAYTHGQWQDEADNNKYD